MNLSKIYKENEETISKAGLLITILLSFLSIMFKTTSLAWIIILTAIITILKRSGVRQIMHK